jgi:hypothetical protein
VQLIRDRTGAGSRRGRSLRLLALLALGGCAADAPPAEGPPIEPRLARLQAEVFAPTCALSASCHGGDAPKEGLDLSAAIWAHIVNRPASQVPEQMLVVPGDPDASYLYQKVTQPVPAKGVRMPNASPPLEARALSALREWIRLGARDD